MKNVFSFLLLFSLSMATAQELMIENPPFSVQKTKLPKQALKALKIKDDKKPLQAPVWKYGEALLKGQFLGYRPDLNYQVEVYVDDPVLGIQSEYKTTLSEDGAYTIKIPLPTTLSVLFHVTIAENNIFYNDYILLSPDKTTELYVDLYQKFCQEGRLGGDKCPEAQYMIFAGANADINNQMNRPEIVRFYESYLNYDGFVKDITGMTLEEYKSYRMKHLQDAVARIPEFRLTRKAAEFLKLKLVYSNMYYLMFADSKLEYAYRNANNIKNNEPSTGFIKPVMDLDFYAFIKEIPINDPVSLYIAYYENMINSCKFIENRGFKISSSSTLSEYIIGRLRKIDLLSADDVEVLNFMEGEWKQNWDAERISLNKAAIRRAIQRFSAFNLSDEEANKNFAHVLQLCDEKKSIQEIDDTYIYTIIDLISRKILPNDTVTKVWREADFPPIDTLRTQSANLFKEKYKNVIESLQQMEERDELKQALAQIIETDKGIAFDLMETQMIAKKLKEFEPLSQYDMEALSDLSNPFFAQYMKRKNEEMIAQIEARKSNQNYRVHQLDETEDEKILSSILQQFEGKVVLIDFWETWCGPCLNAMKQFEPFKEGLMEKGVVFLYLSSASSPVSAWNNMVPTIKGDHYRLTYQQMGYIQKKYGIIGVPAYMIIDKAGEQIYFRVGFEGAPAMTNRLNQALQAM